MIYLDDVLVKRSKTNSRENITGKQRLGFAYFNICVFISLLVLATVAFLPEKGSGKIIFERATLIIPPIVTLIFGHYFRKD